VSEKGSRGVVESKELENRKGKPKTFPEINIFFEKKNPLFAGGSSKKTKERNWRKGSSRV